MQRIDFKSFAGHCQRTTASVPFPSLQWMWLLFFLLIALPARAQFGASLSGTVLDTSGAAIPNATATLTNSATQQKMVSATNATGAYHFSELGPGTYSLAVTAPGFKEKALTNLSLAAETPRDVIVTLQAGGSTESVTVTANQEQILQTADASIGSTITSEEIERLPIFGGDPYELLRTAPGITGDGARAGNGNAVLLPNGAGPGGSNSGTFQTENGVQIAADGQRQADNNFMIDGVSVNSLTHGGNAVVTPNEEAVGQMTVVSTSYDASDGRNSGAQVKVVTKSGSNSLHGGVFFLYDQPGLNAYNKFAGPAAGLPARVQNAQRTWAGSLGGRVIKDKLFYFLSYSGFSVHNTSIANQWVETPEFRSLIATARPGGISTGILSQPGMAPRVVSVLPNNCSAYANNAGQYPGQLATGGPFCNLVGDGIDIGSPTPGGATQLGIYPLLSDYTGGGLDNIPDLEYAAIRIPSQARGNQFNARGDWFVTSKDTVAGSVYFTKLDSNGASSTNGARPADDVPFKPLNSAATLIYIHTFSPSWLNEFRVNGTRFAENGIKDAGNTVNYGNPYINVQSMPGSNPQYGVAQSSTTPAVFAENTYEARDMVTHAWANHILRLGGEVRLEQDNDNLSGDARPVYAMQGLWAMVNDTPIYEAIDTNPNTGGVPISQRYFRDEDIAIYAQHDWKLTPGFTLNTGLRWEDFTPLRNHGSMINYPVLGPAGSELSGMKLVPHNNLWNSHWDNFAPKIGFAWQPAGTEQKVVIRGGFAIAYNHLDVALFNNALEDGPGIANFGLCCGTNAADFGTPFVMGAIKYAVGTSKSPYSYPINPALATGTNASGFPNPYGGGTPSVEVYGALPTTRPPVSALYSFEIETQLPWNLTSTFGYAGSTGRHYARLVNQNFLYNNANSPVYAAYFAQTDSDQFFNALNVQLRHAMRHGFATSVVYTYSKGLDQVSNGDLADSDANQTNPANNKSEWGPSDFDTRNRIVATALYEIPHAHLSNEFAGSLLNGWQINGTYTWHSGFPYTPVTYNLTTTANVLGAGVVNPTRPTKYNGGAVYGCSNSLFTTGSDFPNRGSDGTSGGLNYFDVNPPADSHAYVPGIRRNSFSGPCFQDVDLSFAKQFAYDFGDHHTVLRIQANMYNPFNILQLEPISNGNRNPGANINDQHFGYAQGADAGRVIELLARIQF
jgi:hypothetical protein